MPSEHLVFVKDRWVLHAIVNLVSFYLLISNVKLTDFGRGYFMVLHLLVIISIIIGAYFKPRSKVTLDIFFLLFIFLTAIDVKISLLMISMLLGMIAPEALTNVINRTKFEDRGIKSALVLFMIYLMIFVLSSFVGNLHDLVYVLAALRLLSLACGMKLHPPTIFEEYGRNKPITKFGFLSLWFVFIFIDHFSSKVFSAYYTTEALIMLQGVILFVALCSMIVGGFLIDRFGRKPFFLLSYVYLGIVYAIVSIIGRIDLIVLEGLVWGFLTLLFTLVIWGDMCSPKERIFFIALSIIVVLVNRVLMVLIFPIVEIQQLFSFISLFLFISAFIILLTPETLPEGIRKKRELASYIKKAKEIKEKYG